MKRASFVQWGTPEPRYYGDILMRANPSLHEEAFAVLQSYSLPGQRVIDVGSGQGAFAARLGDEGYAVTSVDKNIDDFKAKGVEFQPVDFDDARQVDAFKQGSAGKFDVAIGMEVIEHVENPWEYCRLLLSLVKPGGHVMITTPNPGSASSRINFLTTGLFDHFSPQDYQGSGHINPVSFHELEIIARGVGAEIMALTSLCRLPWVVVSRRPSEILLSLLACVYRPFMGPQAQGDIICAVLRRPESDQRERVG